MDRGRTRRFCDVCKKYSGENEHDHKETVAHRFHFKLWEFHNYRKALAKNRKGITMEIQPETGPSAPQLDFKINQRRGKYTAHIQTNQFILHDNTIRFECRIKNNSKHNFCMTDRNFFYPSTVYSICDTSDFFQEPDKFIPELEPGAEYKFRIQYKLEQLTPGSNKIHVACNFQNDHISEAFAIIKSIVVDVSNQINDEIDEEPSPYISEKWTNIGTIHKPMQQNRYKDSYPVPAEYLALLKHGLDCKNLTTQQTNALPQIQQMLGSYDRVQRMNYRDFWHILLWMEEVALMQMLEQFNLSGVTVEQKNFKSISLQVRGLEEKRPSVIAGDYIKLRLQGDHTVYEGIVKYVHEKTVEIFGVDDQLFEYLNIYPDARIDVNFVLSRLSLERMHAAIDRLAANKQIPLLFDPIRINHQKLIMLTTNSRFYNGDIPKNLEQMKAVEKILNNQQSHPYIVFGPPGTGKTMTIVEAILQIKHRTNKTILVCAPANSACDNITEKLIPYCRKNELIRVHSDTRERLSLSPQLLDYSNVDGDVIFKKTDITKYRIVVTTLTLIGRYRNYHPDCVFIDEAAQAAEPEAAIAISLLKAGKQIILAGDPQQLGPMCVSNTAKKYGFGISLLERLMTIKEYRTFNENFITMLRLNYRSHPDILMIPNQLFYGNKLISAVHLNDQIANIAIYPLICRRNRNTNMKIPNGLQQQQQHGIGAAVEFCSIIAKERKEGASPSFFNPAEVEMVVNYVKTMMSNSFPIKINEYDIGIVTPYKRQVYKIKNNLVRMNWKNIEVGTTESFQGREKRIIIISTVRAQHCYLRHDRKYNLGFVRNEKRFNVAMTRAKDKLIVIGCPQVLGYDDKWWRFMQLCVDKGTYFGERFKPRDEHLYNDIVKRMDNFHFN